MPHFIQEVALPVGGQSLGYRDSDGPPSSCLDRPCGTSVSFTSLAFALLCVVLIIYSEAAVSSLDEPDLGCFPSFLPSLVAKYFNIFIHTEITFAFNISNKTLL